MHNTGLVLEEEYKETQHVVGGITVGGLPIIKPAPQVIFEDSQGWIEEAVGASRGESQANERFESFLCTLFGSIGAVSDYAKKVYNDEIDASECIQGVLAGITPGVGGTIYNALKSLQDCGWADESYRKFTECTTRQECFAVVGDTIKKAAKGKLDIYDIYFDLISDVREVPHSLIIENLKYSEVICAGEAWNAQYGIFVNNTGVANHCFRIGAGGVIKQSIRDKFKGRDYEIDWNKVDLVAIDSYRYNWVKDPENDHTNLNDFLKPLHKNFKIHSAYRVYLVKKKKNFISLLRYMDNFYYYWDGKHNFFYIGVPSGETKKYRQKIDISEVDTPTKFLFIALRGNMRKSSWTEVSKYQDIATINKKFA